MSKTFGNSVTSLLIKQGITQRELTDVVGVTETAMSRHIQGSREPKLETVANIDSSENNVRFFTWYRETMRKLVFCED